MHRAATSPAQRLPPANYPLHPYAHPPPMPPPIMGPYHPDPRDPRYNRPVPRPQQYPYGRQGSYVVQVNQAQHMRPPMAHHVSDMSARKTNSGAAYRGAPVVIQQDRPQLQPINARRARSPQHLEDDDEDEDEDEETSEDETESDEEEDPRILLYRATMEQRRMALDAQRAQQEAARMMPPPPRPSSVVNPIYNMRQPNVVTYATSPQLGNAFEDPRLAGRPSYPIGGGLRAPSPSGTAMPGLYRSRTPAQDPRMMRRNSIQSEKNVSVAEIEARERALVTAQKVLEREREQFQRQKQRESFGAGGADYELRNRMRRMSFGRDEHAVEESRLSEAQRYIEKNKEPTAPLTAGILKKSGLDRKTPSTRSKKSSREGSSTVDNRKRRSVVDTESVYQEDFKMRIDARRDYEFEIGDKRVELRPDGQGKIELYVAGKTETQYHTSKASSSTGSKLGRRNSHRTRYLDEDDEDDDDDSTERERRVRKERVEVRGGQARRRAETHSGTLDTRPRTRDPLRQPAAQPLTRRTPLRRPASPVIDNYDEDDDEEEEYTPPLYGAQPDEYGRPFTNRWSQGYGPPSPRSGHGPPGSSNTYGYGA
jgi:hypothetical protein